MVWITNNGGFEWHEDEGGRIRPLRQADNYKGGSIDRVDLKTGRVETVYTHAGDVRLCGPNDLVFDAHGGFYFTDLGKVRPRDMDRTGVYYGKADGSGVTEVAYPVLTPNGVGLSPNGKRLYVAETQTGRIWVWGIEAPGRLGKRPWPSPHGGTLLANTSGYRNFDSLAVDSAGNVCVATLMDGGISIIAPEGRKIEHLPMPDPYTTNICFGGPELRTAFITQSWHGTLVAMEWPRPGLGLNWLNIDPKV
jgi:gluconolactonase